MNFKNIVDLKPIFTDNINNNFRITFLRQPWPVLGVGSNKNKINNNKNNKE